MLRLAFAPIRARFVNYCLVPLRSIHRPSWFVFASRGLAAFGVVFAMNSSIHSYMVLAFTEQEDVSLNVGFYYMANAAGRLVGTILSGAVFMLGRTDMAGMQLCLWVSSCLVLLSWLSSLGIPSFKSSLACQ